MRKKAFLIFALFVVGALRPVTAGADGFKLRWVEVDAVLDKDGKAQISYMVRWNSQSAALHGFYFEGFGGAPLFDYESAYALDQGQKRYSLRLNGFPAQNMTLSSLMARHFIMARLLMFFVTPLI